NVCGSFFRRFGKDGFCSQIDQENPADNAQKPRILVQKRGNEHQPECPYGPVNHVRASCPRARCNPGPPPMRQRRFYTEQADRPDWRGDGKSDQKPLQKYKKQSHETALVHFPGKENSFPFYPAFMERIALARRLGITQAIEIKQFYGTPK